MTISATDLRAFYDRPHTDAAADARLDEMHAALLKALESGAIRAAEPAADGWVVNAWVKNAILAGFRGTPTIEMPGMGFSFVDKAGYPPRSFVLKDGVRVVPGGSTVRRGAFIGKHVVVMPPAFVNVGAFVDEGTMIDSHALVGSCAQIGKRVHLSAGAQIGGVLEPAGARPVVIEDDAFVGGLAGVFEGVVVRKRAVLASGVILGASTTIFDLVEKRELRGEVPKNAVVVPGSRPASGGFARDAGIQLSTPVIVKYRDSKTNAATALEEALR